MKVSLSWLSTHIDLSNYTTPQLTDLLTFAGVEVEGVEEKGVSSDKVVVGQIKEFSQHPNADRLSVCLVDDGSGPLRQIVCGAKNFKAGDKVPVALPGAVLPGNFEIKEGKLRGVVSSGMLCSGKELGIGEDTGGLLILDADAPVGRPFKELVAADVLFDLEITPNRPDLLSHLGLARELAALTGLPLIGQRDHAVSATPASATNVKIEAPEACPFYGARLIKGVKVGPSPAWLRARLESVGLRPINSVVDITNFVLLEMGQPLHAFDLAKLDGGNIVVRMATEGEKMLALNGTEYPLTTADLLITDGMRPVAIAGVMGGEDSGVTEATADLLLESAYFQSSGIRRTSRKLALGSDSSYRYERGVDPQQVLGASELATKLILEIAGGTAEAVTAAGNVPAAAGEVTFNEAKTRSLLGIPDLKAEEMHSILTKLGLTLLSAAGEISQWQVPSYRLDLQRSVDLAEEIARVVGLDRVPSKKQAAFATSDVADKNYDFAMQVRQALANRGFFEAQTLRLISTAQLSDAIGLPDVVKWSQPVKNPLSEDHTTLRPSLIPGLIATAALNIRQGTSRLRFFELGRIFLRLPNGTTREDERVAVLLSGPVAATSWHAREPKPADVYELRGLIETLPGLAGQAVELKRQADSDTFLLSHELRAGNRSVGWIAQLHPSRARAIDSRHPVYVAELVLSALRTNQGGMAKFEELPRFPAITRDISMELPADLPHAQVAGFFNGLKEPLLVSSEVFDVFTDESGLKIAKDRKSVAWTLTYRSNDRTLETAEVDQAHGRVLAALAKALPATVR